MHYIGDHTQPQRKRRSFNRPLVWGCLFLSLFALTGRAWGQASDNLRIPATSIGPGSQFGIADFDGDHRPDIAYVQAGQSFQGNNIYCIEFRLSSRGPSCFWLVAPSGGLFVEARDVNGDHAIDLVVSTAWFRKPVAVLLNNGHGNFTAASPSAFPHAFQQVSNKGLSSQQRLATSISALTQSRVGVCTEMPLSDHASQARFRLLSTLAIFSPQSFRAHHGRAPPSQS